MSDFLNALEETRILHRKSDLTNLANAHLDLTEFRTEINARIDRLIAEIETVAQDEWPAEGVIWELYNRCQTMTRTVDTALHNLDQKQQTGRTNR